MGEAWPWLAVAGAGALHGLNPLAGWGMAACAARPAATLLPLALGHATALAGTALVFAWVPEVATPAMQAGFAALLLAALALRRLRTGLALWAGLVALAQGSALMLVPALVPLCLGASPARALTASGSAAVAIAAAAVHLAAMLGVTAALGSAGAWARRWLRAGRIPILVRHDRRHLPRPPR